VVIENAELFESLKSSEFRYRQLAETMTMGLVTCNNDGEIIYINDSLVNILSYDKKEEFLNKKVSDFCEEKSRHKLNKMLSQVLENDTAGTNKNQVGDLDIEMEAKNGEIIPFMIYASPFYQAKKRVGYFAVLADLRSQKKLERMRADFNSMIVHDLRSPLNIIQGYVDIVRTEVVGKVNEEQAELLTIAKDNVFKVLKLIDNFLTASKLEAGHLNIEPEVNSINTLIEDLANQYQVLAKEKKIKLSKTLDENIPFLYFDKFRLEQVFRNYLSNALKFTPPEGNISIVSKLKKKKNDQTGETDLFVEASVSDTGVGIDKEEIHKVFNKYEQTEAGKDASLKGTGLGLAICREIVELHKGEVWVESKLHEGSKFGFTLPIQPVEV
jgi:PAS domain S-box-containing protein